MKGQPFIPETITVHLGKPSQDAPNVTLSFPDYIKNVASSEIYPTWPENAIRANVYAIVSYALNRVYTEFYRSRGYPFDITNSTAYDMAFREGRDIFQPISRIVDELFNTYIRKDGNIEPFFAVFCDGRIATCYGLSQWGTVSLANQGLVPYEILQRYYGNNINIEKNVPVQTNSPSFEGIDLSLGYSGNSVKTIQTQLNRISRNYPGIPKIAEVNGVFGVDTENAVKKFQEVFGMSPTGVVNEATWYRISYIYTSVKKLAELTSEGIKQSDIERIYEEELKKGDKGKGVLSIQYYLAVIGAYYERVSPVDITGNFGQMTEDSVKSFQEVFGLPQTGVVDERTWNDIYRAYAGIAESSPPPLPETGVALYPNTVLSEGITSEYVRLLQQYLSYISKTYPEIPDVNPTGYFGPLTKNSVTAFQKRFGIDPSGVVGPITWNEITGVYSDLKFGFDKRPQQFPGYTIS